MGKSALIVATLCMAWVMAFGAKGHDADIEKLKRNYRDILLSQRESGDSLLADFVKIEPEKEFSDQVVIELHQRYPLDISKIERYLNSLGPDGKFTDIDYDDKKRSGWAPKQHAERVLELAKLYRGDSAGSVLSSKASDALHKAIGYWLEAMPRSLNWWYNEIGVPKTFGPAFLLLEDELSEQELDGAIKVMEKSKFGRTGQNKVWLAGNVLIRGLLQNDAALVKAARDTIASEITVGDGEGIQRDWSFHQHGSQQQFGNYGMAYLSGMAFYKRLFEGTSFAFDKEQAAILDSLVNEGYRWVVWNRHMDVSSLGRQLFHNAQLHKGYATAFAAADLGIGGFGKCGNQLTGHKHFSKSDYTVHRRPRWMATVKMSSSRVIGTELVNEDNINGYYLGDGATYYYTRGDEYLDAFPLWNWRRIPGVTAYDDKGPMPDINKTHERNMRHGVGGITEGECGMSAMDFEREGLSARKAWVFGESFVVCLGAGISSDSASLVVTSIDQRAKRAPLEVRSGDSWQVVEGRQSFQGSDVRLFHDNTGYIVLGSDSVEAISENRKGSWSDNMRMYTPEMIEGEMVDLAISHGASPKGAAYAYIVLPASDKEAVAAFDLEKSVSIIRNDENAQIVRISGSKPGYWVAKYDDAPIEIGGSAINPSPGLYYFDAID